MTVIATQETNSSVCLSGCVCVCVRFLISGLWWKTRCRDPPPFSTNHSGFPLQLKYRKDLNKMKGTSHFHSLTSEDNLALKNARKINKIVSEVGGLAGMTATTTTRHHNFFMIFTGLLVAPQPLLCRFQPKAKVSAGCWLESRRDCVTPQQTRWHLAGHFPHASLVVVAASLPRPPEIL